MRSQLAGFLLRFLALVQVMALVVEEAAAEVSHLH
jgi:hypothetical protein